MNQECVGVGINFRREIESEIVRHLDKFDLIEVLTDSLFVHGGVGGALREVMEYKPIAFHGLRASLGAAASLDSSYRDATAKAVEYWKPLWFSDHLSFSSVGDINVDQLLPVRRTQHRVDCICEKIQSLREGTTVPFLVENITYYYDYDDNEISEDVFINNILSQSGCGLLLDINNLYINACNHGFDPYAFVERLDLSKLTEIHMAGGFVRDGMLIDSHGHRIDEPVWRLLEFVGRRAQPRAVIIERDTNFDIGEIIESVSHVREILNWRAPQADSVSVEHR